MSFGPRGRCTHSSERAMHLEQGRWSSHYRRVKQHRAKQVQRGPSSQWNRDGLKTYWMRTFLLSFRQLEHASLARSPPRGIAVFPDAEADWFLPFKGKEDPGAGAVLCVYGTAGESTKHSKPISTHRRHGLPSSHLTRACLQASHPSVH